MVTETYPPEVNGVARTVALMVDGLRARGHELQLVRPRQGAQDQRRKRSATASCCAPASAFRATRSCAWACRRSARSCRPGGTRGRTSCTSPPRARSAVRARRGAHARHSRWRPTSTPTSTPTAATTASAGWRGWCARTCGASTIAPTARWYRPTS